MTIKDFILECENYSHSKEHYELMKEAYEHNLLCEYIDYNQYNDLMSNNELSILVEDAQQKKEGILSKVLGWFKHIFDMFIKFLSKFIPALRKQEETVVDLGEIKDDSNKDSSNDKDKDDKIITIKTPKSTDDKSVEKKKFDKNKEDLIRKIKESIFDDSSLDKYFPYIEVLSVNRPFPYNKLTNREKTIVEIITAKEFKIKRMKDDDGNHLLMSPQLLIRNAKVLFTKTDVGFDRNGVDRFLDDMNILKDLNDDNNKINFQSTEMKKILIELKGTLESINTFIKDFERRRTRFDKSVSFDKLEIDLMKSVNLLNKSVSNYIQFCTTLLQFREKHLLAVRNLYTLFTTNNIGYQMAIAEFHKTKEEREFDAEMEKILDKLNI